MGASAAGIVDWRTCHGSFILPDLKVKNGHQKIETAVFSAIEQLNRQLPSKSRLKKRLDEFIIDKKSKLDSLGLINFLVGCEQEIEKETGHKIILTGDEAFQNVNDTFRTVGTLISFISKRISE
ncbi:MAG: hypothetical protein ACREBV_08850 [Candidatus Zixiibacteriota bacterium]